MNLRALLLGYGMLAVVNSIASGPSRAAEVGKPQTAERVEARTADLLAVGLVHGDRMTIHLSRLVDNAPVRDAALEVLLRGVLHPTTAESDGSYGLQTPDLKLPGAASVEFRIAQGTLQTTLKGTLLGATPETPTEDKNSARQMGWWVLNFAVCIAFLMLLSKRRKAAERNATNE